MQINVVNILIDCLMAHRSCSIDNLGTFTLHKQSAEFTAAKSILLPPKYSISFHENDTDGYPYHQIISDYLPLSYKKAKGVENVFASKIINGLINYDVIKLMNFGSLKRRDNAIEFEIDELLDSVLNKQLREVSLAPYVEAQKALEKVKKPVSVDSADLELNKVVSNTKKEVEQTKMVSKTKESDVTKVETISKSTVNHHKYPKEEKSIAIYRILPWILLLIFLGLCAILGRKFFTSKSPVVSEKEIVKQTSVQVQEDNQQEERDTLIINQESAKPTEDKSNIQEAQEVTIETVQEDLQPSTCIIICGSFLQNESTTSVVNKIRAKGYQIYTEPYNYYTRVGFEFNCEGVNLKRFLEEIKRDVNKGAWYLVPPDLDL